MLNKRQLNASIRFTAALKALTHAYEGISVMHIQKVRQKVIKSRQFLDNLEVVYGDVRNAYRKQLDDLIKKKKDPKGDLTLLNKNGKTAALFISANSALYGEIVPQVFQLFLDYIKKNQADVIIIGKYGKKIYEESGVKKTFLYFDLPDIGVQFTDLKELLLKIISYQKVDIFYGQFENTMTQKARLGNISGQAFFETESVNKETHKIVFEPDLEKVLQFFETQVFNNLFHQVVQEAELARHGSRIKAMEASIVKIEKEEKGFFRKRMALKKLLDNKKRLEGLSGISLWK